jgi:hypothetical protein
MSKYQALAIFHDAMVLSEFVNSCGEFDTSGHGRGINSHPGVTLEVEKSNSRARVSETLVSDTDSASFEDRACWSDCWEHAKTDFVAIANRNGKIMPNRS